MGRKAVAVIVILLAVLAGLYLTGFFDGFLGTGFNAGHAKLQAVYAEYGVDQENLTPGSLVELDVFGRKLKRLKTGFESGLESRDSKALVLLVEAKIELVEMETNILEAAELLENSSVLLPDCSPEGDILTAAKLFREAKVKAGLAGAKTKAFAESYPDFSEAVGIGDGSDFEDTIGILKNVIDSYTREAELRCGIASA